MTFGCYFSNLDESILIKQIRLLREMTNFKVKSRKNFQIPQLTVNPYSTSEKRGERRHHRNITEQEVVNFHEIF